jgi:integrase
MSKRRLLPRYVSNFIDTRGRERVRFRKTGCKSYYFEHPFGTEGFRIEYRKCLDAIDAQAGVVRKQIVAGSVEDLVIRYLKSGDFAGEAKAVTLSKNRAIIEKFRVRYADLPVRQMTFEALDKIITAARVKKPNGTGGNFAAQKLRKELKRLLHYAVKLGWLQTNPMEFVNAISVTSEGFHTWTEDEIRQYQNHWIEGSKQRAVMEMMLWTAKRVGDIARIGPQHVTNGYLVTRDQKTGKQNALFVSPQLRRALSSLESENLCYIVTSFGKPYSQKGLSQSFSQWCTDAGLKHCSAHGLRKAMARRLAENGATNSEMKAITQHSSDAELAVYTNKANQVSLGQKAMEDLSRIFA